jgi:MFS family permease
VKTSPTASAKPSRVDGRLDVRKVTARRGRVRLIGKSATLMGRWPATFASLRYPNYRRWFVGQSLSLMGTWMQSVAQGWVVYELTGSKLALGTITFVGSVPSLFFMLPGGALADRMPRRRLLVITQTSMMVLAFVLAFLTATKLLQVWQVAILAVGLGIANSFDVPARQAIAVDLVDDRSDLQNAIGLNSTMFNLARVVGPAVGGLILAVAGAAWCFALNGLSFLAVIVALLSIRLTSAEQSIHPGPMIPQIVDGLRYVWSNRPVRAIIALVGVSTLFGFSYAVLMPVFAVDVLNVGEAGLGMLNAAVGVGALIAALAVASLSHSRYKMWQLGVGSFLFPLALIGLALSRFYPLSLAFLILIGFAFISQNATANTVVQAIVPDDLRGRVMGVYSFLFFGTAPFGALLAGAVAQAFSAPIAVAAGACITLTFTSFIFLSVRSLRELEV